MCDGVVWLPAGDCTFSLSLASLATVEPWKYTKEMTLHNPFVTRITGNYCFVLSSYLKIIFFKDGKAV